MTFKTLVAASALVVLAGGASAQEAVTLRFSQLTPPTHFYHTRILMPWVKDVTDATQGRVKIEITTAPLAPMPRNFDIVQQGTADAAAGNHGPIVGRFKVTQITEGLAAPGANPESVSVAFWRTYEKHLRNAVDKEHEGTKLLMLHTSGSFHFFTLRNPIEKPADFSGIKMLAPSATSAKLVEKLGSVPIVRSVVDYYDVVSKGVVDSLVATNTSIKGWKAEEFVKHQLSIPGGALYGTFFLVVNQKKWESIKPEDQQAVMKVSGEVYAKRAGKVFHEEDIAAEDERRKAGKRVAVIDDPKLLETVKSAFSFIDDDYIKAATAAGVDGKAALAYFRQQVTAYKP